jgi:hypothetical protein
LSIGRESPAAIPAGRTSVASRRGVALVLVLLLTAAATTPKAAPAPEYKIGPAPLTLLPGRTLRGEQLVRPGDVIAQSVLGRPETALLLDPIAFDRPGQKRTLTRETVLQSASVPGVPGNPSVLFCEAEPPTAKAPTSPLASGLVAALRPAPGVTRYCLYDSDNDEKFDHAILIGAKGDAGRAPFEIPPAKYGLITGMTLGGGSELRLRFAGPVDDKDALSIDVEVNVFGMQRILPGARHRVAIGKLPAYAVIEGAVVTIVSFDPVTRLANIRIDHDLAPGHFILPDIKP